RYTGTTITLTRHGKPIACLVPVEDTMTIGTRVTVPDYSVPEGRALAGEIVEKNDETVIVELDDGHRQELPTNEIA
ncbi:hypothetical protein KBZ21_46815, partial [Streptomyces sp. A73]|nr:hypothetical protein [Streptomyces sp. A73]